MANTTPKAASPTTMATPGWATFRQRAMAIRAGMAVSRALQNCTAEGPGGLVRPQARRRLGANPCTMP